MRTPAAGASRPSAEQLAAFLPPAAFLLAQRSFEVWLLGEGLQGEKGC